MHTKQTHTLTHTSMNIYIYTPINTDYYRMTNLMRILTLPQTAKRQFRNACQIALTSPAAKAAKVNTA